MTERDIKNLFGVLQKVKHLQHEKCWRDVEVSSDDNVKIINFIENYMRGSWQYPDISMAEDLPKLQEFVIEAIDNLCLECEYNYERRLRDKLHKSEKISDKINIYKFFYVDKPIKKISCRLSGKKFRLYDYLPASERLLH
jgi:hypothetical protein